MTLHIYFTQCATRAHILEVLESHLYAAQRKEVEAIAQGSCGLPVNEHGHFHNLPQINAAIDACTLSDRVKTDARAIYLILATAEATVHNCALEETHFHEVGKASALANTLAICRAFELLNPAEVTATPVQTGRGIVHCAHGELEIPAPATATIIARGIPVVPEDKLLDGELLTPTSAAIILHFVDRFISA